MNTRGRTLKYTAVIALVVLSLTGFSTGRHHGRYKSSHGGGCSSSSQDHDSSSSSTGGSGSYGDDDDDSYGSSSGGSSYTRRPTRRPTPASSGTGSSGRIEDGTVKLLSCATEQKPYATVEVANPNAREVKYVADVAFEDFQGNAVVQKSVDVKVTAKGRTTVKVFVNSDLVDEVDHCWVNPAAYGS